jgi:hypothetical protein
VARALCIRHFFGLSSGNSLMLIDIRLRWLAHKFQKPLADKLIDKFRYLRSVIIAGFAARKPADNF